MNLYEDLMLNEQELQEVKAGMDHWNTCAKTNKKCFWAYPNGTCLHDFEYKGGYGEGSEGGCGGGNPA